MNQFVNDWNILDAPHRSRSLPTYLTYLISQGGRIDIVTPTHFGEHGMVLSATIVYSSDKKIETPNLPNWPERR